MTTIKNRLKHMLDEHAGGAAEDVVSMQPATKARAEKVVHLCREVVRRAARLNLPNGPPVLAEICTELDTWITRIFEKHEEDQLKDEIYLQVLIGGLEFKLSRIANHIKTPTPGLLSAASQERKTLNVYSLILSHTLQDLKNVYRNHALDSGFRMTKQPAEDFWRGIFSNQVLVAWQDLLHALSLLFHIANEEVPALKATMDITETGYISWFEFDVFVRLFQPWDRLLVNWSVVVLRHPGYQKWMTYDEAMLLLQAWAHRPSTYVFRLSCTRLGQWAIGFVDKDNKVYQTIPVHQSLYQALVQGAHTKVLLYPAGQDENIDLSSFSQKVPEISIKPTAEQEELYSKINTSFHVCKICSERPKDVSLEPCNHLLCRNCLHEWQKQKKNQCPFCRNEIRDISYVKVEGSTNIQAPRQPSPPPSVPTSPVPAPLPPRLPSFSPTQQSTRGMVPNRPPPPVPRSPTAPDLASLASGLLNVPMSGPPSPNIHTRNSSWEPSLSAGSPISPLSSPPTPITLSPGFSALDVPPPPVPPRWRTQISVTGMETPPTMRSPCESMSSLLAANGAGRESELETVEPKMPENQTGFPDYDSLPTVCANSAPPRPARVNRSVNGTVDAQTVQPSIRPTSTELFDQPTQTPSLPLHRTPPQAPSSPPHFTPLVPQTHPPDLSTLLGFGGAGSPPAPVRPVGFEETESDYETVAQSRPGAKKKKSQTHISLSRVQSMDPPDTESLAGVEVSIPEPKPQPSETFDQSSRLPSPPSHRTPPQFPSSPPNFTPMLPQTPPPDLPNLFGPGGSGFPSPPVRPGGFKETESDYETVAQSSPGAKKKKSQSQISLSMAQSMDPPGAGAGGLAAVEVSIPEPKTQPLGPSIRPTSTEFFDKPTGIPSLPLHRTPPQVPSSPPNFTPMLPQIPPSDLLTHLGLGGAVFSSHPVRSGGLKETESDYETVAQSSLGAKRKKSQSQISLSMAQSINPPVAEGAAVSISDLKLELLGPPSAHPASPTTTTPNENFDQPTTTSMHRLAPQIPSSPPNFTPVLPQTPPLDLASTLGSGRGILSPPVQSEGAQEPGSEYDFVTQTGPGAKKESHPQNPSLVSPSIDPPGTNMPVNKPPSVGPKEQNSLVHEFSPMTTTGTNKDTGATAECRADTEIAIGWGSNKDADRRKPSNTCLQISGISKIITKIRKATSRTSVPALPDLSKLSGNSEDAEKGANLASRGNEGVSSPTSPRGPVSSRSASHTDSFSVGNSGGRSTQGVSEGMGGLHGKGGPGTSRFTSNTVLPQVHFSSSIRTPPVENSSPPTATRKSPSASSLGGSLGASKLMAHLTFLESETDAGQGVSGDMKKLKATVSIAMHPRKSYATEQKESIIVPTQRSSAPNLSIHGVDTRPAVVLDGEENTQESIPIPEKPTSSGGISGREQQESPWSPPIPDKLTTSMISCLVLDTRCYEEEAEDWGGPISPASANLPNSSQTCADAKSPSPPPTVKGPPTPPTPRGSCAASPPIPAKSMASGISVHANSRQEGEPMDTKRFLAHANPLTIPETPPPVMHRPPPMALPFEKDEEDYDIPGSQISMATPVPPSRPPLSAQTSTTTLPIEHDEEGYAIPDNEISKTPLATAPSRTIQPPPTPTFGALRVEKGDDDYTIPGDENGKFQPPLFKPPPVPHPQANLPIAQDDEEYTIPGYHIDAPLAPSRPPPSPFTNPPAAGEIATDEDEYAIPSDNPPSFPTTSPSPLRPPPTPCRPTPTPTLTQAASAQTRAGFEQVLDEEEYDIPSPTLPPSVDTRLFWQGGGSGQRSATSLSGSSASTVSIQSQVPNRPPPIPNLPSGTQHGCEVEVEKDEDGYAIPSSVADSSLSVICVRASTPPLAGCPSVRGDNFGVLPNGAKGWQVSNPPTQSSNSPRICRPIGPSGSAGSSNIDNKPPQMDSVSGAFSAARMSPPLPARTSRGFGPMGYHHPPLSRLPSSSPNTTIPPIKPPRRREEAPPTPTTTTTQSAPSSPAASPDLPPRTAGCVLIGGKQRDMSPIGKKPSGDLILKKAAVEAEVNRPAVKMVVSAFEQLAELESTDLGSRRNSGNSGNGKMRSRGSSIQSYSADSLPATIRSKLDDDRGAQRKFSAGANGTRPRQQSAGRDGPTENSVWENVRGSRSENSNLNGGGGDPDFEFLLAIEVRGKGFGVAKFESTAGQLKQGVQEEDEYDVLTNIRAK